MHISVPLVVSVSQLGVGRNTTGLTSAVTDRGVHLQHALSFASGIIQAVVDYPADLTQITGVVNLSFSNRSHDQYLLVVSFLNSSFL